MGNTYGPKANFKISLRQLPDFGRFRVTVKAARYDDGLLLDSHDKQDTQPTSDDRPADFVSHRSEQSEEVDVPQGGRVYRVDVIRKMLDRSQQPQDDARLNESLAGHWQFDGQANSSDGTLSGKLVGDAQWSASPFGQALQLDGKEDALVVERTPAFDVGTGDFTVSAWINPKALRQGGIVCLGKYSWTQGWYLDMPDNQGRLRIETAGPDSVSNGTVTSAPGTLVANTWQHITAVVRRGENDTRLYVNGYAVAKGTIGPSLIGQPESQLTYWPRSRCSSVSRRNRRCAYLPPCAWMKPRLRPWWNLAKPWPNVHICRLQDLQLNTGRA